MWRTKLRRLAVPVEIAAREDVGAVPVLRGARPRTGSTAGISIEKRSGSHGFQSAGVDWYFTPRGTVFGTGGNDTSFLLRPRLAVLLLVPGGVVLRDLPDRVPRLGGLRVREVLAHARTMASDADHPEVARLVGRRLVQVEGRRRCARRRASARRPAKSFLTSRRLVAARARAAPPPPCGPATLSRRAPRAEPEGRPRARGGSARSRRAACPMPSHALVRTERSTSGTRRRRARRRTGRSPGPTVAASACTTLLRGRAGAPRRSAPRPRRPSRRPPWRPRLAGRRAGRGRGSGRHRNALSSKRTMRCPPSSSPPKARSFTLSAAPWRHCACSGESAPFASVEHGRHDGASELGLQQAAEVARRATRCDRRRRPSSAGARPAGSGAHAGAVADGGAPALGGRGGTGRRAGRGRRTPPAADARGDDSRASSEGRSGSVITPDAYARSVGESLSPSREQRLHLGRVPARARARRAAGMTMRPPARPAWASTSATRAGASGVPCTKRRRLAWRPSAASVASSVPSSCAGYTKHTRALRPATCRAASTNVPTSPLRARACAAGTRPRPGAMYGGLHTTSDASPRRDACDVAHVASHDLAPVGPAVRVEVAPRHRRRAIVDLDEDDAPRGPEAQQREPHGPDARAQVERDGGHLRPPSRSPRAAARRRWCGSRPRAAAGRARRCPRRARPAWLPPATDRRPALRRSSGLPWTTPSQTRSPSRRPGTPEPHTSPASETAPGSPGPGRRRSRGWACPVGKLSAPKRPRSLVSVRRAAGSGFDSSLVK